MTISEDRIERAAKALAEQFEDNFPSDLVERDNDYRHAARLSATKGNKT